MLPKKFSTFSRPMHHNHVPEIVDIISALPASRHLILWSSMIFDPWSFDLSWSLIFWSPLIFDLLIWADLWSLIFFKSWSFLDLWSSVFLIFWSLIFLWSDLLTFDLWTPQFMLSWSKFKKNRGWSSWLWGRKKSEICFEAQIFLSVPYSS